ncbi:hypothetical protein [Lutibaculum baratangense]|nr:hypothetical protein [Lutibaculum baratangense]
MKVSLWLSFGGMVVGSALPALTMLSFQDGLPHQAVASTSHLSQHAPIALPSLTSDGASALEAEKAVLAGGCPAAKGELRLLRVIVIEERKARPTPLKLQRPAEADEAAALSET